MDKTPAQIILSLIPKNLRERNSRQYKIGNTGYFGVLSVKVIGIDSYYHKRDHDGTNVAYKVILDHFDIASKPKYRSVMLWILRSKLIIKDYKAYPCKYCKELLSEKECLYSEEHGLDYGQHFECFVKHTFKNGPAISCHKCDKKMDIVESLDARIRDFKEPRCWKCEHDEIIAWNDNEKRLNNIYPERRSEPRLSYFERIAPYELDDFMDETMHFEDIEGGE